MNGSSGVCLGGKVPARGRRDEWSCSVPLAHVAVLLVIFTGSAHGGLQAVAAETVACLVVANLWEGKRCE